jgi:hypothetical protein
MRDLNSIASLKNFLIGDPFLYTNYDLFYNSIFYLNKVKEYSYNFYFKYEKSILFDWSNHSYYYDYYY